jgi:polyhydroxyalkanoate synthesis regulator phasin
MMTEKIEFYRAGLLTAIYVDGELVSTGDHAAAEAWLRSHNNVETVFTDAFLQGGKVALTTREIRQHMAFQTQQEMQRKQSEIEALRARLAELEE